MFTSIIPLSLAIIPWLVKVSGKEIFVISYLKSVVFTISKYKPIVPDSLSTVSRSRTKFSLKYPGIKLSIVSAFPVTSVCTRISLTNKLLSGTLKLMLPLSPIFCVTAKTPIISTPSIKVNNAKIDINFSFKLIFNLPFIRATLEASL